MECIIEIACNIIYNSKTKEEEEQPVYDNINNVDNMHYTIFLTDGII